VRSATAVVVGVVVVVEVVLVDVVVVLEVDLDVDVDTVAVTGVDTAGVVGEPSSDDEHPPAATVMTTAIAATRLIGHLARLPTPPEPPPTYQTGNLHDAQRQRRVAGLT
jgi:hypothetical protein